MWPYTNECYLLRYVVCDGVASTCARCGAGEDAAAGSAVRGSRAACRRRTRPPRSRRKTYLPSFPSWLEEEGLFSYCHVYGDRWNEWLFVAAEIRRSFAVITGNQRFASLTTGIYNVSNAE